MKKYRYVDPSSQNIFQRARPYVLLFVVWNVFGYTVWTVLKNRAINKDPGWETRSEQEKVAMITGVDTKNMEKHTFNLFGSVENKDSSS